MTILFLKLWNSIILSDFLLLVWQMHSGKFKMCL